MATYPPRECGIATFTKDLLQSCQKLFGADTVCQVAAMNLSALDTYEYPKEVAWQINQNSKAEYKALAQAHNKNPHIKGTILEHEYGIFGGEQGEKVLSFVNAYKKPLIVTFHTVLPSPALKMHSVTESIISKADKIVVLTQSSKTILESIYPHSIGKIKVIPHGIHNTAFTTTTKQKKKLKLEGATVLSTFGLLSRGKGIEYVIQALPRVVAQYPHIRYLVLGETHPVIRRNEGEAYRLELIALVTKLKLQKYVKFYDQYLDVPDLLNFLKATDIYISTSINPNQAVSGTLSYALGAGRAVISTDFSQAKEIITKDTGALVPIQDSDAFAKQILALLSEPKKLVQMHSTAYCSTRSMLWSNVAAQFSQTLDELQPLTKHLVLPQLNLSHLTNMTDEYGLFQFAQLSIPNKEYGYTLDDNARALIAACQLLETHPSKQLPSLILIYADFINKAQTKDGKFINYFNHSHKSATEQNVSEDIEESHARALWGLATVMNSQVEPDIKARAKDTFLKALPHALHFTHMRSKALAIKTFSLLHNMTEVQDQLSNTIAWYADSLIECLEKNSNESWYWFDTYLGYNNAILSESLLIAGKPTGNDNYTKKGLLSLQFLIDKTFSKTAYMPIGNQQWHKVNEVRSVFDQQPEDPASMILALSTAFEVTQNVQYKKLAFICFSWFLGNNALGLPLYDIDTGGCFDGLHADRVNLNQGAESLVSYLLARSTIARML